MIYILSFVALFEGIVIITLLYILRKTDLKNYRLENFYAQLLDTISVYNSRIDSIFEQSIHYYDDTIYEFVETTKAFKKQLADFMLENEDLKESVYEEPPKEQEQELIGIAKNYPLTRITTK